MFHATGGDHLTSDDMFCGAEVNNRKKQVASMEKEKDARILFAKRKKAAVLVLRQGKFIDDLSDTELGILLLFHGVPVGKMGNKPDKKAKWQAIINNEEKIPSMPLWTDQDEAKLQSLKDKPIELGDTAFGRFVDNRKQEAAAVYSKMTKEERADLKRKMAEIDEEEEEDESD